MHIARQINESFALAALHGLNAKEQKTRFGKIRHRRSNQWIIYIMTKKGIISIIISIYMV